MSNEIAIQAANERAIEIAQSLLVTNLSVGQIAKHTGLTLETVISLAVNKPHKVKNPRCSKCVNEIHCTRNKDDENKCPDYKRDASDGGFYG